MRASISLAGAAAAILLVAAHGAKPYKYESTIETCDEGPCQLVTDAETHGGFVHTAGAFEANEEYDWTHSAMVYDSRPNRGEKQMVRVTATFEVTEVNISPPREGGSDSGRAAVYLILDAYQYEKDGELTAWERVSERLASFRIHGGYGYPLPPFPTQVVSYQAEPGTYTLETTLARDDGEPLAENQVALAAGAIAWGESDTDTDFSYDVRAQVTSMTVEPAS